MNEMNTVTDTDLWLSPRFLVAYLQMEALKGCRNVGAIKRTLGSLPSGLEAMYELTMKRIEAQSEEDARIGKLALVWVSRVRERLTGRQLQEAVATSYVPGSGQAGEFHEEDMTKLDLILSAAGGLLVVEKNGEVRLVRESCFPSPIRAASLKIPQTTPRKISSAVSNQRRSHNTRRSWRWPASLIAARTLPTTCGSRMMCSLPTPSDIGEPISKWGRGQGSCS